VCKYIRFPALVTDALSASQHFFFFFTVYRLCTKYAVRVRCKFDESIWTFTLHTVNIFSYIANSRSLCNDAKHAQIFVSLEVFSIFEYTLLLLDIASRNNNAVLVSVMELHRTSVKLINRKLIFAHTDISCGQCHAFARM